MPRKIVVGLMAVIILVFSSCYPELSVQQYDQLRDDLAALDIQRQELTAQVSTLQGRVESLIEEANILKEKTANALPYIDFLNMMVSTQSSELILTGQFDVSALLEKSDELVEEAALLADADVSYYLSLMDAENESQTVSAYYKIIELSLKKLKSNLE